MKKHPAKYSDGFTRLFADILLENKCRNVLDPMAGTGKICEVRDFGFSGEVYCNDLEEEWKLYEATWTFLDAASLPYPDGFFDAIVTSPTYGNRMADHHNAKDGSSRITYTHRLGRKLKEGNTGQMQWGEAYKKKHSEIWEEAFRVLKPGGILVLNISDHIRKGQVVPVASWHYETLESLGFKCIRQDFEKTRRMRFGKNSEARIDGEWIFVFRKKA